MFSVHKKTKWRRFQIPPVSRAISKSSVFMTECVDGRPNRRNNTTGATLISPRKSGEKQVAVRKLRSRLFSFLLTKHTEKLF